MDGREARPDRSGAPRGQQPASGGGHQLVLRAREEATITGVLHVASFDEREIVLDTTLGTLTLTGHDLQIKQLDLVQGTFWVQGLIDGLRYTGQRRHRGGPRVSSGGAFGRLFR